MLRDNFYSNCQQHMRLVHQCFIGTFACLLALSLKVCEFIKLHVGSF
jgi:hypothetical protein